MDIKYVSVNEFIFIKIIPSSDSQVDFLLPLETDSKLKREGRPLVGLFSLMPLAMVVVFLL